jgi:hypothetical protein
MVRVSKTKKFNYCANYLKSVNIYIMCKSFSLLFIKDDEGGLPSTVYEEYRPFLRRLPEFKFWFVYLRFNFFNLLHKTAFIQGVRIP